MRRVRKEAGFACNKVGLLYRHSSGETDNEQSQYSFIFSWIRSRNLFRRSCNVSTAKAGEFACLRLWAAEVGKISFDVGVQVLTALAIETKVWVVIACSVVGRYHRFGGPCFLHCHGSFVTLVVFKPHGVTYLKTVKTSLILNYYRGCL